MVRPCNMQDVKFTGWRGKVAALVEHPFFHSFIAGIIIANAITLGMETNAALSSQTKHFLHIIDQMILSIFVVEISLKLFLYRWSFFRAGWNVFDFTIVAICLLPAAGGFAVLRTLRILRVLRLLSIVPAMRRVITALLHAIPGMASIITILFIIFYVASVLATQSFGRHEDEQMFELFGTMGNSMFTLFQVMTLEGWAQEVARPTMELFSWAWAFFVLFIIVTSFAVLNLFIGIIVDAMNMPKEEDITKEGRAITKSTKQDAEMLQKEIKSLRREISEIKKLLKQ